MKPLKKLKNIAVKLIKGAADAIFPNINKSIAITYDEFPYDNKLKFDWIRLFSAVSVWALLLLVFFGKIQLNEVIELIKTLISQIK
jgi:hypothetical protein